MMDIDRDLWRMPRDQSDHEPGTQKVITEELQASEIFWDIGANVGTMTAAARRASPDVRIVAVEASPLPFLMLSSRFRSDPNVTLILAAAWRYRCFLNLTPGMISEMTMTSVWRRTHTVNRNDPAMLTEGAMMVPGISLDELAEWRGETPHLLKIDCEGGDLQILRGAEQVLKSETLRLIICEATDRHCKAGGSRLIDLEAFVRDAGFKAVDRDGLNLIWRRR